MEIIKLRFLLAVIAFSTCVHNGSALYFVQVEHTVPRDLFIGNGWIAEAILDPDDSGNVIYSIVPQIMACPALTIDENNGNVTFEVQPHQGQRSFFTNPCAYKVSAKLQGQPGHRNNSETSMNLTISTDNTDCVMASNEYKCFGGLKQINVQVLENNRAKVKLVQFGQNMTRCGKSDVEYVVIDEDIDVISIEKNTQNEAYELWAKAGLDREYKSAYEFKVQCTWMPQNGVKRESRSISGRITVLDENDNGPKTQDSTTYEVYDISFEPNGTNLYKPDAQVRPANVTALLVLDRDTRELNRFHFTAVNDTWNLLKIDPNVFSTDRNVTSTGVFLRILLTNETTKRKPWTGRYCVKITMNDTTLISRPGNSPIMIYMICLHWGEPHIHAHGDNHVQPSRVPHEQVCGQTCKFYLSVTGAVCLVALCGMCVFWRFRTRHSKRRKCPLVKPGGLLGHGLIHGEDYSDNANNVNTEDYMAPNGNALAINSLHDPDIYILLDPKWEIPRSELLLEQILGEGEFGKVLKGRLKGLSSPEGYINVAVKMLKDNHIESGKSSRQEFMAEFVLLKQVDHPNVIKLIGACTAAGGPLYLVMEYAELGSLRSFLRKCRKIESLGDPSINPALDASKYVVSPKEVLGFSWQIAKGMTYLSDMKMVHRDLAARNILVTQNKVCKISDFGLTRDIYVDDAYKKKSKDRVPVKWLAPECLADELYTTKSDVWSYGILLWELATLGASPYPGIPSEQVYSLLKSGYRMQQPPNCSFELYCLMRSCWAAEPINRPSFREIDMTLSKLLEDGIEYLQLDVPMVSNPGYFNETQTVVLASPELPSQCVPASDAPFMYTFLPANRTAEVSSRLSYDNINPPYMNYEGAEDLETQEIPESHVPASDISHLYESPVRNGAAVAVQD